MDIERRKDGNTPKYLALVALLSSILGGAGGNVVATSFARIDDTVLLEVRSLKTQIIEYRSENVEKSRRMAELLNDLDYRLRAVEKKIEK